MAAYVLLLVAWAFAMPPGSAPDEPADLVKALGVVHGQLLGTKPVDPPVFARGTYGVWLTKTSRDFKIPRNQEPAFFVPCYAYHPHRSAVACVSSGAGKRGLHTSYVGTYQPFMFAPAGAAAAAGPDVGAATLLGRLGNAVVVMILLAGALFVLWDPGRGPWPLMGLMVAVTPMALYAGATVSPSGIEIAAGLTFAAGLVRLERDPDCAPPRWVWLWVALSGAVLGGTRSLGPLFLACDLAVCLAFFGRTRSWRTLKSGGPLAVVASAATAVGAGAGMAWEALVQPHPAIPPLSRPVVVGRISSLPAILRGAIGVFGWLDTDLPATGYATWIIVGIIMVALACRTGSRRRVGVVVVSALALAALTVALAVAVLNTSGEFQGRYILPIAVALPLYWAEAIDRRPYDSMSPDAVAVALGAALAGVQVLAWYTAARRFAVGTEGPLWFMSSPGWGTPARWALGLATVGTAGVLMSIVPLVGRPRRLSASCGAAPPCAWR